MDRITKSMRIQVLLDVLSRWGRLDKQSICHHLSTILQEDFNSQAGSRAVYRDLDELVNQGKISVDYYTRDGVHIDEYDPAKHKNVSCFWYIPSAEGLVPGSGILKTLGCLLYVSRILKNEISVIHGKSQPDPRNLHLYFICSGSFVCIKIATDALPFSIVISRTHGEITDKEIDSVQKSHGQRFVILKIPDAKLSSFKGPSDLGHAVLRFESKEKISVEDLGSTNGNVLYRLKLDEADHLREYASQIENLTLNKTWNDIDINLVSPLKVQGTSNIVSPFLLEAGGSFKILAI